MCVFCKSLRRKICLLKLSSWKLCPVSSSYANTYPRPFLEYRRLFQACRTCERPSAPVVKVLLQEMATGWQDFFIPHWLLEHQRLSENLCLLCQWERNMPEHTPRGLCLIISTLLVFPRWDQSHPLHIYLAEDEAVWKWADSKEGGWRWEPQYLEKGDEVSFQSSFHLEGWAFFECISLGLASEGQAWSGDCGLIQRKQMRQVHLGLTCCYILLCSTSPRKCRHVTQGYSVLRGHLHPGHPVWGEYNRHFIFLVS